MHEAAAEKRYHTHQIKFKSNLLNNKGLTGC